jgi:hypothetical protein
MRKVGCRQVMVGVVQAKLWLMSTFGNVHPGGTQNDESNANPKP